MVVFTDQPGRYMAVFVVGPALFCAASLLDSPRCATSCRRDVGRSMRLFATVFMLYEIFWICARDSKKVEVRYVVRRLQ